MPVQTTKPSDYPQAVIQQIELLAQNIVIARKRRKETQAQWAKRLGVSQPTMARIERGDPAVAMASYVMCLWLINPTVALSELIAPSKDNIALEHEVARVQARRPKRARPTPKARRVSVRQVSDKGLASGSSTSTLEIVRDVQRSNSEAKLVEDMKQASSMAKLIEDMKQASSMTKLIEDAKQAGSMTKLIEDMKQAGSMTKLIEDAKQASSMAKLIEDMKRTQTPTALGLAALISKPPGTAP
jgi:DNA-binding XRE family transcriptional regulator/peptidyl-tRNA hydrolase